MDKEILKLKNLNDVLDEVKKKDVIRELFSKVDSSREIFNDAYQLRRKTYLEINALYRNKSYLDERKVNWQTRTFVPLTYDAVERKTSIIHEALWGNRIASPFSVIGRTSEDQVYASSAEALLNNTMDRIGFYPTSEETIRSAVKYGMGVYRYGWVIKNEEYLARETKKDDKGKVVRVEGKPVFSYVKKNVRVSQPFVRSVDIVDNIGWDPRAKSFDKWACEFVYEVREETPEEIWTKEQDGLYAPGSFKNLTINDPHGVVGDDSGDKKLPQMRKDNGLMDPLSPGLMKKYSIVDWYGWFDIDKDGKREFVKITLCPMRKLVLSAEENLLNEYPFVDIQYSKSLHSLTPWGVVDPVIQLQYQINELNNQRGDAIKHKLTPQWVINVDKILEDHAYVSEPGALHPFQTGDEDVAKALRPLEFQNTEYLSSNEEDRLVGQFERSTGVADLNKVLGSSNKDTPATTVVSILNEQQAGNSLVINGVLERHGVLGNRILKLIQLFGDDEFIIRSSGRKGFEFKRESLENILGEFDTKVTTSTFFGNKQIELQHLIQLKPMWAQAPHVNQIELDKAILENIMPKRVDKILQIPDEPLSAENEQLLLIAGQGEALKVADNETLIDLRSKLRSHRAFKNSPAFKKLDVTTIEEFEEYLKKLEDKEGQLGIQELLMQQSATRGMEGIVGSPDGNLQNSGLPGVRQMGNTMAPKTNNFPSPTPI